MGRVVTVTEEPFVLPVYQNGTEELHPIFAEEYDYHGGKGKVYPYRLKRALTDQKKERTFSALCMENEYLKLTIVPELGGRVMRAVNKLTGLDFVHGCEEFRPVLLGELGATVIGGIDFFCNHGEAYAPVTARAEQDLDGSCSVWLHRFDQANSVRQTVKLTLFPERAYVQISGQLYNMTPFRQQTYYAPTLAVAAQGAQMIFPTDAKETLVRSENCKLGTSAYDFIGAYDSEEQTGILQISDHYVTPQRRCFFYDNRNKKAADSERSEPRVALLTSGSFEGTELLPMVLAPFEERRFLQYLMPYQGIASVKNAMRELAVGLEVREYAIVVQVYGARRRKVRVTLTDGSVTLLEEETVLSPENAYEKILARTNQAAAKLRLTVFDADTNAVLIVYRMPIGEKSETLQKQESAGAEQGSKRELCLPQQLQTNDALYLAGRWLEERQPSGYDAADYYAEGLKRDAEDVRMNHAYGELLMQRGDFAGAKKYLMQALKNSYSDSEAQTGMICVLLGLCAFYQGKERQAAEAFHRALRAADAVETGTFYLAAIAARNGIWTEALDAVGKTLSKNAHHIQARGMQAYLLRKLGQSTTALRCCKKNLEHAPFDFVSAAELVFLGKSSEEKLLQRMGDDAENYLAAARDYLLFGAYQEAAELLERCPQQSFLVTVYRAYALSAQKKPLDATKLLHTAEWCAEDLIFPNQLADAVVLTYAAKEPDSASAQYELGCLWYAKGQYEQAIQIWEHAVKNYKQARIFRNLALAYANVYEDWKRAAREMEKACYFNDQDATLFWELDQIRQRLGYDFEQRLKRYEKYMTLVDTHDELYVEYVTLLNLTKQFEKAHDCAIKHRFHVWEACGEKLAAQYVWSLLEMANRALVQGDGLQAERYLMHAVSLPENLGIEQAEERFCSQISYHLGLALELQEKTDQAEVYYKQAAEMPELPESVSYCENLLADQQFFKGLALLKRGKDAEGAACFDQLISYGTAHLEDEPGKTGARIWQRQPSSFRENHTARSKAHCHYFIALGLLGHGEKKRAQEELQKVLQWEPSNVYCQMYLNV